jgi:hypothetical protein
MQALGPMSIALETARKQLAACTSYRAFLGASDSASAVASTYLAALPAPTDGKEYTAAEWEQTLRPFAMIYTSSAGGYSATRSALYAVRENGRMFVELEITIPEAYQPDVLVPAVNLRTDLEKADRWILNQIGQIVFEFMGLAGCPGYLDVSSVTVVMGPSRERHEEPLANSFYYWTLLEVIWGATE